MTISLRIDCKPDDPCLAATRRAYRCLRSCGLSEADAFSAAVRVLRTHHPDLDLSEAYDVAAAWIDSGDAHGIQSAIKAPA